MCLNLIGGDLHPGIQFAIGTGVIPLIPCHHRVIHFRRLDSITPRGTEEPVRHPDGLFGHLVPQNPPI